MNFLAKLILSSFQSSVMGVFMPDLYLYLVLVILFASNCLSCFEFKHLYFYLKLIICGTGIVKDAYFEQAASTISKLAG